MEELKHTAITFEGILKLENKIHTFNYYINNSKKVENREISKLLNWWMENEIEIDIEVII